MFIVQPNGAAWRPIDWQIHHNEQESRNAHRVACDADHERRGEILAFLGDGRAPLAKPAAAPNDGGRSDWRPPVAPIPAMSQSPVISYLSCESFDATGIDDALSIDAALAAATYRRAHTGATFTNLPSANVGTSTTRSHAPRGDDESVTAYIDMMAPVTSDMVHARQTASYRATRDAIQSAKRSRGLSASVKRQLRSRGAAI